MNKILLKQINDAIIELFPDFELLYPQANEDAYLGGAWYRWFYYEDGSKYILVNDEPYESLEAAKQTENPQIIALYDKYGGKTVVAIKKKTY